MAKKVKPTLHINTNSQRVHERKGLSAKSLSALCLPFCGTETLNPERAPRELGN